MPGVEKFKISLKEFKIDERIENIINENSEELRDRSSKRAKANYFKRAIDIMDTYMDHTKVQEILEWNACCKGGARKKASMLFAKEYSQLSLEEKLDKVTDVPNMGIPILNKDGTLTINAVSYIKDAVFKCACPNFNNQIRDYPVSRSYCYCCGGHFKYHYEIMLGIKLRVKEVVSSPLDSYGTNPCVFTLEMVN